MIKNNVEYEVSQKWVENFKKSLVALDNDQTHQENDPFRWQMNREAIQTHLEQLQAEIAEYERLMNCDRNQPILIQVDSIDQLPDALIKSRIAARMTQQELAQILGVDENQVKEWEDSDYQCASFLELLEASSVLGLNLQTTTIQVDFNEIEAGKKSSDQWQKKRRNKSTQTL